MQETVLEVQQPLNQESIRVKETKLGLSFTKASSVVAQPQGNGLLSSAGFRGTRAMQEVCKVLQRGELGPLYAVELVSHAFCTDKPNSKGCIAELGAPLLGLALWALDYPNILSGKGYMYTNGQPSTDSVEDYALALLEIENDLSMQLCCSWNLPPEQEPMVSATFYGINGAVAFKSIPGKPGQFMAERYDGPTTNLLYSPEADAPAESSANDQELYMAEEEATKLTAIIDNIFRR